MAENAPKKRAPARKPPTKAAALKALGLTQADLDAIKNLRDQPANAAPVEPNVVEASAVLHPASGFGGDGLSAAPSDPQGHLENRNPPPQLSANLPAKTESVWYMRNLRDMEVNFRLSRQTESGKKRTHLEPRGRRGDIVKLEPEDLRDVELQTQVQYGLVEVIPEGEALEAIRKQYNNAQTSVPAHIAALRNPLGQEYDLPVRTLSDEEAMGYKVADLDPALMQGKLSDREIKAGGGFAQPNLVGPVQNPSPGRIISDGFLDQTQTGLGNSAGDNERAAQVDALARSKQFEGPGAGLGDVVVRVAPTQKS